jgi:hypothetical protein|tara:strand:+ start:9914 stop:11116 length:1203 start_codon:yes stop_codon:yes gene_type:complete
MKIAVVGVGTAGLMSLCHFLAHSPKGTTVTAVYDPAIDILGIGESSTWGLPKMLFQGTGFNLAEYADWLDATPKFGVSWKNWRDNDFESVIQPGGYGIHFNNFKMKEFCFMRFEKMWQDTFKVIEGTVSDIVNNQSHASVIINNNEETFDLVVDCRGYPTDYTDYNLIEDMPVNHCLVHTITKPGDWNTTIHQATKNGWMFGIPLKTRQGWGYLYNDKITSKQEATNDIADIFDTPVNDLKLKEFSFKPYYAKTFFDGRILKNGNTSLFFEPLEALSGFFYESSLRTVFDFLEGQYSIDEVNTQLTTLAQDLELFYHYVYHGGSTFDSPFWDKIKTASTAKLASNPRWQETINLVNECITEDEIKEIPIGFWFTEKWIAWEEKFNYSYFKQNAGNFYFKK